MPFRPQIEGLDYYKTLSEAITLDEISDILIATPSDNQLLQYVESSATWINVTDLELPGNLGIGGIPAQPGHIWAAEAVMRLENTSAGGQYWDLHSRSTDGDFRITEEDGGADTARLIIDTSGNFGLEGGNLGGATISGTTISGATVEGANTGWDSASAHTIADGSSHTFIDQDVTTTGTPAFSTVGATTISATTLSSADVHMASAITTFSGADTLITKMLHSKTITIMEPQNVQAVSDNVAFFPVEADEFPFGIVIDQVYLKTGSSVTTEVNLEKWSAPDDGTPDTLCTIGVAAAFEGNSAATLSEVGTSEIICLDLDTASCNWLNLTVVFHEPNV